MGKYLLLLSLALMLIPFQLQLVLSKAISELQDDELVMRVQSFIDRILRMVEDVTLHTLRGMLRLLISLARIAYIVLAVIGLIMWATGFSVYSGRKFLMGSLLLALLVELMRGVV